MKPFCLRGHPRTPETLNKRGGCAICTREQCRAWKAAHRKVFAFMQSMAPILPVWDVPERDGWV